MRNKYLPLLLTVLLLLGGCGSGQSEAEGSGEVPAPQPTIVDGVVIDDAEISEASFTPEGAADFILLTDYKDFVKEAPEDAVVQEGNCVNIDFTGYVDGNAFDGGSAKGYELTIGSGDFIEGFEDQLIGAKKGDQVTVTVTFPSTYPQHLADKEGTFEVTVNSIMPLSPIHYVNQVINQSTVRSYPADVYREVEEYFDASAAGSGVSEEEYYKALGASREDFIRSRARTLLTNMAICAAEGITADSEEFKAKVLANLAGYGFSSAEDALAAGFYQLELDYAAYYDLVLEIIQK